MVSNINNYRFLIKHFYAILPVYFMSHICRAKHLPIQQEKCNMNTKYKNVILTIV